MLSRPSAIHHSGASTTSPRKLMCLAVINLTTMLSVRIQVPNYGFVCHDKRPLILWFVKSARKRHALMSTMPEQPAAIRLTQFILGWIHCPTWGTKTSMLSHLGPEEFNTASPGTQIIQSAIHTHHSCRSCYPLQRAGSLTRRRTHSNYQEESFAFRFTSKGG